jgi:hypothetical protein
MCRVWILSSASIAVLICLYSWGSERQRLKIDLPADLIGDDVHIVGRTGVPLATMMRLEGRWIYEDVGKDDGLVFHVTNVNGAPLGNDAAFWAPCVHVVNRQGQEVMPKKGAIWKMKAFETGQYDAGVPNEYLRMLGREVPQSRGAPVWLRSLTLKLVGIAD